jgi:hypothetical protein
VNDRTFLILVGLLALFAAFQQWIRHQRRLMIHRERLAALDKGVELPPFEQETRAIERAVQRILLFAGLVWLSVGIGMYLVLERLVGQPPSRIPCVTDPVGQFQWIDVSVRDGMQWIGITVACIGVSHLIVYMVSRRKHDERSAP